MRTQLPLKLEEGRILDGHYASRPGDLHGAFTVRGPEGRALVIMSSGIDDEYGWEHVSVSIHNRPPTWTEMCFVKDLFWSEVECVVQYHPAMEEYVNYHPNCLHLWRPLDVQFPIPPALLVGPKE